MFTEEFKKVSIEKILNDIKEKGYFAFESALTEETVKTIQSDATLNRYKLNANRISGIFRETQYYFVNLLTVSQKFFDFCTSSLVINICKEYLGDKFRLKALRYYETFGGHHMKWHTDNKNDKGFQHIPGLIFIFYTSDVEDGEFQYINGSHLWSGETNHSDYEDNEIEEKYKELIQSFKMLKGSLIIYNTYGIHRAKPMLDKKFIRKSVFFQIDSNIEKSEPILVNTKFLKDINSTILMYLGFGKDNGYPNYPKTDLNILPIYKPVFNQLINWFFYRIKKNIILLMPSKIKIFLKKIIK